jgi:dTDP-4-dehydrorhamnose reductase
MPSVVVVTGASSGMGLATTQALAAAGWNVIATARHPETAESLRGIADELSGVQLRTLDVTSDESVDSCIGSILTDLGVSTCWSTTLAPDIAERWNSSRWMSCHTRWRLISSVSRASPKPCCLPCALPGQAGSSP